MQLKFVRKPKRSSLFSYNMHETMVHLEEVAKIDGPGRMSESFFPADFVEVGDDVLARRLVHVAQGHEDAGQAAVPV